MTRVTDKDLRKAGGVPSFGSLIATDTSNPP